MASCVSTKILILSDTHGLNFPAVFCEPVDVVMHCGDLTERSSMPEYEYTLQLLRKINAPLKLFIAGNHDLSLGPPALRKKVEEAERAGKESFAGLIDKELLNIKTWINEAKAENILYLDEGIHEFVLGNGALMKVYASAYTPSTEGWAFEYSTHDFNIDMGTDVVITHGPPRGVLDISGGKRIGCPQLFRAVAQSQPKIHCFGHVHQGWGARLVAWKQHLSKAPTHLEDIDNSNSSVLEHLGTRHESYNVAEARKERLARYKAQGDCRTSHCADDVEPLKDGRTLFINAAIKGSDELYQAPWLAEIDLESAESPKPEASISTSSAECGETKSRKRNRKAEFSEANESKRTRT
ncbi:calcineurin-like phosphoesterase [Colletotrichum graminicola]|uniref:Calcineurin-like phosphoesterase n=1 Tax=Colletotrichum graminicola (strain M1.001 / M2 / FGSC 10212) TaxID=645133 RepID=E3Q7P6_COLGM|nr:calcineurin-like phosphoesterase [Colletotrichum graminicola M1.001]EFQ26908.1 calcineurin-like phosphoesterase [Colletotrichum graminicola M1.001]WDK16616.1 calcineurin-like phosphoesterase [Colletotrichum graminicola]